AHPMAIDGFIATVWSGLLQIPLRKAQVFTQPNVVNRDYEGEIRQLGDAVRIGMIGEVTISDYTKNTDMSSPETLNAPQATLVIDKAKSFNFQVDDVDKAQIKPALAAAAMQSAAYKLSDAQDTAVAGQYADAAAAVGSSGSPKTDLGTAGQGYTYL